MGIAYIDSGIYIEFPIHLTGLVIEAPINPLPKTPGRYFRALGDVWRRVSWVSFALLKWRGVDGQYAVVEGRGR